MNNPRQPEVPPVPTSMYSAGSHPRTIKLLAAFVCDAIGEIDADHVFTDEEQYRIRDWRDLLDDGSAD